MKPLHSPNPESIVVCTDLSAIEKTLHEAVARGEDIHARTARELFGEVNRDTRSKGKAINFSSMYGQLK